LDQPVRRLWQKPEKGVLVRIGIEDRFGQSGKPDELMEAYGISAAKIAERVLAGK